MSGQECPACEVLHGEPACTGAAGCVWHRMQAEADAARAREERIKAAREAVRQEHAALAARLQTLPVTGGEKRELENARSTYRRAVAAMIAAMIAAEKEGETP